MNFKKHRKHKRAKYFYDVVWSFKKNFKRDYQVKKKFKKLSTGLSFLPIDK